MPSTNTCQAANIVPGRGDAVAIFGSLLGLSRPDSGRQGVSELAKLLLYCASRSILQIAIAIDPVIGKPGRAPPG